MSQIRDITLEEEEGTFAFEQHTHPKASVLYQLLPATVQSRMAILYSLRRFAHDFGTQGLQSKSSSIPEPAPPGTPPPDYTSAPTSGNTTPKCHGSVANTSVFTVEHGVPMASSDLATSSQSISTYECSTDINWQHARHGVVGLEDAHRMAYTDPHNENVVVTAILRSQYLHSITLLLRSLPPELTPGEQLTLSAALPPSLLGLCTPGITTATRLDADSVREEEGPSQTILWQMTSCLVFKLLLLVQFILPYLRISFRYAAQFEHDHQLVRRAFQTSCALGDKIGRKLGQTVYRIHNGVIGGVLSNAAVYCAEGLIGGIQQGLTEASKLRQMRAHEHTADMVIR